MNDLLTLIAWRDSLPESERPGPTELWMLAAMSTLTGGDGTILASFAEIAKRYGCEDRNAKYLIAKLKKRGSLRVLGREDQKNIYVLEAFLPPLEKSAPPSAFDEAALAKHDEDMAAAIMSPADTNAAGYPIYRAHDALRSASLDARELDGIAGALAPPCMLCGEEPQVAGGGGSCATCTALEGM